MAISAEVFQRAANDYLREVENHIDERLREKARINKLSTKVLIPIPLGLNDEGFRWLRDKYMTAGWINVSVNYSNNCICFEWRFNAKATDDSSVVSPNELTDIQQNEKRHIKL